MGQRPLAPALTRRIGTTRGPVTLLVGTVSVVWLVTSVINHVAFHAYSSFGECLVRPGTRSSSSAAAPADLALV